MKVKLAPCEGHKLMPYRIGPEVYVDLVFRGMKSRRCKVCGYYYLTSGERAEDKSK